MKRSAPSGRGDRVTEKPPAASLQARLRLAVVGAALLFLLHATALAAMTRFLGKDTQYLTEAIDSAVVMKSIELDLLRYDHANQAADPPGSEERATALAAKLRGDLADVRRDTKTPEEEQLADEIGRRLEGHLAAHRDARVHGAPSEATRDRLKADFKAIQSLTERLVNLKIQQANQLLAQATSWYRVAIFMTIAAAVAVGLGLVGALVAFNRWIRRPLAAAASAIARFEAGDHASRAEEVGPTEVREIAETFNDMAATLTRQENDRIAFIGGVAHDLRGPVSAIQMANAMLDPEGPLRMEQTRAIVVRQTARLERMVGDFLDAVQIHAGHLDIKSERVNLGDVVRESVEQYRAIATDHEIVAAIPSLPVVVQGDSMRLAQVLNNLLSNAAKYSPSGGPITVSLELDPDPDHDEAVLAITDRGIGIHPGEHEQIFEPFRRTGASRELTPGVGLGLSITRRIVEAHGGRIAITSTPGCGSTFRVVLPSLSSSGPSR